MNPSESEELIAEAPIREALRVHRPNAEQFAERVRDRVAAAEADAPRDEASEWLRTAAALIPLPLLPGGAIGKAAAGGPWTAKLVGAVAAPPLTLLLAIGGFVLGLVGVRSAQRHAADGPASQEEVQRTMNAWWWRYGAAHVAGCGLLVALMFYGHTLPAMMLFFVFGVAVVALVSGLGRVGRIDRATLAVGLAPAMMLFAQLVSMVADHANGTPPLLDQSLAAAVLCGGAVVVALLGAASTRDWRLRLRAGLLVLPLLMLTAMYSASRLRPITTEDVRTYVENDDVSRFGSATWRRWAVAADWLRDTGRTFDPAKPRALFAQELAGERSALVMAASFRGGLVEAADAESIAPPGPPRASLVNPALRDVRLPGIERKEAELLALEQLGRLTPADRAVLAERLVATIDHAVDNERGDLLGVLAATRVLNAIGHSDATTALRERVQAMLVEFQRLERRRFGDKPGGFALHRRTNFGDELATTAAVELMEVYGTPAGVDVLALRSYLRPQQTDWLNRRGAVLRFVARERLGALPDARPPVWSDYVRCEPVIGMAVMTVVLAVVAALGCKPRRSAASRRR